ncbi:hypothetical protein CV770_03890 [Bradyrhizobium sp. AC87j1]|nr:hypothetical protein CV770_03890 [Bradyrhizobium sp. AC87j1]
MFPPAAGLARASASSGLARQERDRKKALGRLAGLREKAAAEIERLMAFLDASDPYASTELEDQVDDHPCDDSELDRDESDDEPSLGSHEITSAGAVSYWPSWHPEVGVDVEEQCDDEGAAA